MTAMKMGDMDAVGSICNPTDLAFKVYPPGTTVDKIRDLQYFGSNNVNNWRSGYKKDFQYPHPAYFESPDKPSLRRVGEVILKNEAFPPAITETRKSFIAHPVEKSTRMKNDPRYSKGRESNDRLLGGDDRLTNFKDTTSKTEHCPLDIESRTDIDKVTRLHQIAHVPIGNLRLGNQYIKAKNVTDYPRYPNAAAADPKFTREHLCESAVLFRDANLNKMDGISTVNATYRVYGDEEAKQSRGELVTQSRTVSSVLFPITNIPSGTSESRRVYKPFSTEQQREVAAKPSNWDCSNIFCKDARIDTPQTTLKSEFTAPPVTDYGGKERCFIMNQCFKKSCEEFYLITKKSSLRYLDANGKRAYKYAYGDIVHRELETDPQFIPKELHQQSLTQDDYRHYGNQMYKVPTEHRTTVLGHIPASMEDGPINKMETTHTLSYPAHDVPPYVAAQSVEKGGITTAIPLGGEFRVKETEFQDNYRRHKIQPPTWETKDLHSTTFKDAVGDVDYRTTHKTSYMVPADPEKTLPAQRLAERNTILNDVSSWRTSQDYLPPKARRTIC